LLHKRMEALPTQLHAGEITEQRGRGVIGPRAGPLSRRRLPIALLAPKRQSEDLLHGINPAAARGPGDVRTLHWHWPPSGLDRAGNAGPSWHLPMPLGTTRSLSGQLPPRGRLHNGLAQAAGERVSPLPHGFGHLGAAGWRRGERLVPPIPPLVTASVEVVPQALPLGACAALG
jgi:hypothetical protein